MVTIHRYVIFVDIQYVLIIVQPIKNIVVFVEKDAVFINAIKTDVEIVELVFVFIITGNMHVKNVETVIVFMEREKADVRFVPKEKEKRMININKQKKQEPNKQYILV